MSEETMGVSSSRASVSGFIITLDALGTLYRFREPFATQYLQVASSCGLKAEIEPKKLNDAFKHSFRSMSSEYPKYGKAQLSSPRVWWKTLTEDTFRQVVEESQVPPGLGDRLYEHFSSRAAYELYPDVKDFFRTISQLRDQWGRGADNPIVVGVISNSDPRVKGVLESLGLSLLRSQGIRNLDTVEDFTGKKDIDFLCTSYEAGYEKPDKRIYDTARQLAIDYSLMGHLLRDGLHEDSKQAARTSLIQGPMRITRSMQSIRIHIGDDYEKDYKGAQDAGWESLHLVREGEGKMVEGASTVSTLTEAATILRVMVNENFSGNEP